MTPRALYTVAALALAAVVLAVLGERQSAPGGVAAGDPALPGLAEQLDDVTRVTIVAPGGETAATLERGAGTWTVAELDAYPADLSKLRAALLGLSEARIVERMTDDPSRYERIGVEDVGLETAAGTLVRIETGNGASHELILGHSDRAEERYARRPGQAASILIDRDPDLALEPAGWVDPVIVDVPAERVASVSIRHADGETLELTRAEPSQRDFAVAGVPEGREVDRGTANATGGGLRGLRLEAVARFDAARAGEPVATIGYTTFDGLEITIDAYEIDGEPWLALGASPGGAAEAGVADEAAAIEARIDGWRYRVAERAYGQMTRRLGDLLAQPE